MTRALVLHPLAPGMRECDAQARLVEAAGLAEALDLQVEEALCAPVRQIQPHAYFGSGRIDDLAAKVETLGVQVVVIDAALTPVQQRNLEKALNAKVVDRTGLILEIFARRAATREGRLQVELARLGYERSRLVRTWTHLERQRGGLGKTGGPGETQIELDRRLIADRIVKLKRELEDVRRTRGLHRRARDRAGLPTVVLVGYTNAGKSSLFNALTQAGVLAKNMPFATLDPTARLVRLPSGRSVVIADTVGFITDLPTELVAAFRATLEAIMEADVIVHVRDIADAHTERQKRDVLGVLEQLSVEHGGEGGPKALEAWNKADLLTPEGHAARAARAASGDGGTPATLISAVNGEGMAALLSAIDQAAFGATRIFTLHLSPSDGRRRAMIAARGRILSEELSPEGLLVIRVELCADDAEALGDLLLEAGGLAAHESLSGCEGLRSQT